MRCSEVEALWDELRGCEERHDEPVFVHLGACTSCQAVFKANDGVLAVMAHLKETTPPEGLCDRILDHIKKACSTYKCVDSVSTVESPLGTLYIACHGEKISYVAIQRDEAAEALAERIEQRLRRGTSFVAAPDWLLKTIDTFFSHWKADDERLDTTVLTPFELETLRVAAQIPPGEVRSYGWIAKELGRPNAARAVGQVMARNPLALVFPCHRVVDSSGALHQYAYGVEIKARLLTLEGYDGAIVMKSRSRKKIPVA